jgi:hypothetical protein
LKNPPGGWQGVPRSAGCAPFLVSGRPARPDASGTHPAISQRQRRDIFVEHPFKEVPKLRRERHISYVLSEGLNLQDTTRE